MSEGFDEQMDDQLTQLFALARSPGTADELSLEAHVVGAMVSIAAGPSVVTALDQRRRVAASKAGVRAAIVVAAVLVGTSTAAATGNLPDAAQSAVARATSHVGIELPDPNDHHESSSTSTTPSSSLATEPGSKASTASVTDPADQQATLVTPAQQPVSSTAAAPTADPQAQKPSTAEGREPGPDLDGPAKKGLCQAWASHGENSQAEEHSTTMARLQDAAVAAGQTVEQFCAAIEPTPSTDVPTTDKAPKNDPPKVDKPPTDKGPTDKGPTDKGPTDNKGPTDKGPTDKAPKGPPDDGTD